MSDLDKIIHQPARLKVMATLSALPNDAEADFVFVRDELGMTDGNLGSHLSKLETAGYIKLKKAFENRKPRTYIKMTAKGRDRFETHVTTLRQILGQ
ncbi:winged helix-turn-helix domain-containing protein [Poriferisphaera sp. WC338]|uniref:winged helix-turn-helix domain-containing protein n=1 Tax=Poriferisphaera sp. WC338 TaxID=3425129 RepID=UPI003D81599F